MRAFRHFTLGPSYEGSGSPQDLWGYVFRGVNIDIITIKYSIIIVHHIHVREDIRLLFAPCWTTTFRKRVIGTVDEYVGTEAACHSVRSLLAKPGSAALWLAPNAIKRAALCGTSSNTS